MSRYAATFHDILKHKPQKFGKSLGFGIKPWVQKFGVSWQYHLARAILEPHNFKYRWMDVPRSPELISGARSYLTHNEALWQKRGTHLRDFFLNNNTGKQIRLGEYIPHHSLIASAYNDVYRFQVVHGFKKVLDRETKSVINDIKAELKYAQSPADRRQLKSLIRTLELKNSQRAWEIAAAKSGVISASANPAIKQNIAEVKGIIQDRNIAIIKMQMDKLGLKEDILFDKKYYGRDAGVYIGTGNDRKEEESDWARLVKYLKKTRWIRGAVWDGIMKKGRDRIQRYLKRHLGSRQYREFFLSFNARGKYATDAYFVPRSEFGYRKLGYDNKKGELSPLQRVRGFKRSGKEYIRKIEE